MHAAAGAGLERTIAGWVPNFVSIAPVLAASDLLATLPSIVMADTLRPYGLESRPVPFSIAPMPHAMLWGAAGATIPRSDGCATGSAPIVKSQIAVRGGEEARIRVRPRR